MGTIMQQHLGLSASTFRGVIAVLQYAQNRQVKQQSTKSIMYTTAVMIMVRKAGPKKACKYIRYGEVICNKHVAFIKKEVTTVISYLSTKYPLTNS